MRYSIIAAALVGAVAAIPAYAPAPVAYPETETIYGTVVSTITSCGPEVTDCPAKSTSAASSTCTDEPYGAVPYTTGGAAPPAYSTAKGSTTGPAGPSVTAPVYGGSSSSAPWYGGASSSPSAPVYGGSSSSAPWYGGASSSPSAPVYGAPSSSPVAPVYSAPSSYAPIVPTGGSTPAGPVPTVSATPVAPYPYSSPAAPYPVAPSGTAPVAPVYPTGTGAPSVGNSTGPKPPSYTGAASNIKAAAGAIIGAGAFAAFFL